MPATAFAFEAKAKLHKLAQAVEDAVATGKTGLELISSKETELSHICDKMAEHEKKLTELVVSNRRLQDQFDQIDEQDLLPEQLQAISVLQRQIESLEDQVIDRDAALQEIENQMRQDYEQHNQLIGKLKLQVSSPSGADLALW